LGHATRPNRQRNQKNGRCKPESAAAARERLEDFDRGPVGPKYPAIAQSWRRKWEQVVPFFAFAPEV
jgi:putative transposase